MDSELLFTKESVLQMFILLKKYNIFEEFVKKELLDINNKDYCSLISNELVFGLTPLHVSVIANDLKAAKMAINLGANINSKTMFAIRRNRREVREYSSLHLAVIQNNQQMVELLVESNAYLEIEDDFGLTPLEVALNFNNTSICCLLILSGADVNGFNFKQNKLPLIYRAIVLKNLKLVEIFGQILRQKYIYCESESPIEYAMNTFPKCVETLINLKVGLHSKNEKTGETLLHLAICKKNNDWIQLLLENGLDPNIANKYGNRPLHIAVFSDCNSITFVQLIYFGANPDYKNNEGFTPLYYAVRDANISVTELLLKYNSRISSELHELRVALNRRNFKMVLILLDYLDKTQIQTMHTLKFDCEPIIWYFIRFIVNPQNTDRNDLVKVLNKLIELGSDVNSIHDLWGTLMHFIIYAMECQPNSVDNYKAVFDALISSPKCDLNKEFESQDTFDIRTGEEIFKERIEAFGTALSFALSLTNSEFFAEQLIKAGADVRSFDWNGFWFSPNKMKALKMLYYSGCPFPKDFLKRFEPVFYDFDESYEPEEIELHFTQFKVFNKWLNKQRFKPWTLKCICRRFVRENIMNVPLCLNRIVRSQSNSSLE